MASIRIAGVIGKSPRAVVVDRVRGRENWVVWVRQGVIELIVLGEIVSVIA